MKKTALEKFAEKEFRRYARKNLPDPRKVKQIEQTQRLLSELHQVINDYKIRFNYVPEEARLKFNAYKDIQDSMVYDHFRQTYRQVLC